MSKPLGFEKPLGMRDVLPGVLQKQRWLQHRLLNCMEQWGYREIMTPTLEYYDTVGGASATLDERLFKLLDRQGKTLVLRPDMTAPIARVASSLLKDEPFPLRLMYSSNVFRAQAKEAGRNAEYYQTGVELIGSPSVDADAEVIALAVFVLKEAGVPDFKIAIGHVGFLDGLLEETVDVEDQREALKEYLHNRNFVGFRHYVESLGVAPEKQERLRQLLTLRGGKDLVDRAEAITINGKARKAVQNLRRLWEALEAYRVTDSVLFDLNLLSNLNYYTGILFEGYAAGQGFPLCTGGRYDRLMAQFGRPAPATGFAVQMDRMMEATSYQPEKRETTIVLYTEDQRTRAFEQAQILRQLEGGVVVTLRKEEWDESRVPAEINGRVLDLTKEEL